MKVPPQIANAPMANVRPDGYRLGWKGGLYDPSQPPQPAPQAFRPGQAQSQQSPWATGTPYGQQPVQQTPPLNFGVPSFQFRATDFMGNQYSDPGAFVAQQGAMAQALNNQRGNQIANQRFGSLDPGAAYAQASEMVRGGFANPFADDSAAQIRRLSSPVPGTPPGGSMDPGPVAGTQMYRPPTNPPSGHPSERFGKVGYVPYWQREQEHRRRAQQERQAIADRESDRKRANEQWLAGQQAPQPARSPATGSPPPRRPALRRPAQRLA